MITMYAIPNCDTVKKSRRWLEANGIDYTFHDYKKQGVPADFLEKACTVFGWQRVVNQKGMTWKRLNQEERDGITTQALAIELMQDKPTVIKRPIVEKEGEPILIGFDEKEWADVLR